MTGPLSEEYLAEVQARCEAAPPAPWRVDNENTDLQRWVTDATGLMEINFGYRGNSNQAEARFTAHAREDVPALLAEVRRLREVEAGRALVRPGSRRDLLLLTIRAEGGEWTVGRAKALYAESDTGHIYRSTIRADLGALHRAGYLVQHDSDGQRYYTADKNGGSL